MDDETLTLFSALPFDDECHWDTLSQLPFHLLEQSAHEDGDFVPISQRKRTRGIACDSQPGCQFL